MTVCLVAVQVHPQLIYSTEQSNLRSNERLDLHHYLLQRTVGMLGRYNQSVIFREKEHCSGLIE